MYDPDDPNNPYYPSEGGNDPTDDPNKDGNGGALDEILEKIKDLPLWQLIASVISIILIIAFLSKTASNESKRKKTKKVMEKKYNTFYATAFLGISVTNWTVIASVLMGVAVLTFVFMLISQKRRSKAEEELEDAKDEYERNQKEIEDRRRIEENQRRDEDMKMMFMHMMGNNGNMQGGQGQPQGFAYVQPSLGAEEIRGIVSETMTALLPSMQQMLPQQASTNDEVIKSLIEGQKAIMQKLSEMPSEKIIEREVASADFNDERILKVVAQSEHNDEKIDALMRNQETLMKKIDELTANKNTEKEIVEKIVEVPVEKVVEKEVRVEVPVEVEKIVEKEVVKEVPVEVEKVVEKIVTIPAEKPASKAKTVAPRLTLDEAYAKLSAKQKKFFDTIKEYAMSKDKCKEKKSTYYILLG
ncbi:MAG: hypothetical protein K2N32_01770, partial [Clostridia bacterium]|nr:hypothetical protein [Clostridia bacterium]